METFLQKLVERHPEKGADIIRLAGNDECFRAVCEEIELAESATIYWKQMPARVLEYEEILNGLKIEFWTQLSQSSR